ncbi:hypothetical protein RUMOBE_03090 [Blautia obeum ATCC 29174]|uniref:Uncharacterized protein n=1 Tax=Blautia obeum ATCC 29174 TaxID=411459 RepID=A5ZVP7_9FIRM|nr:hypothetical protein RUMOBE_03090 [Blautia obeum ATCC 29174]
MYSNGESAKMEQALNERGNRYAVFQKIRQIWRRNLCSLE